MSEKELQAAVIELARWHGYLTMHITDSRKSNAVGFPDLVLCHRETGRVLYVELKSATGRLRPGQREWLDALQAGRHVAVVWRPEHWLDGTVRAVLEAYANTGRHHPRVES